MSAQTQSDITNEVVDNITPMARRKVNHSRIKRRNKGIDMDREALFRRKKRKFSYTRDNLNELLHEIILHRGKEDRKIPSIAKVIREYEDNHHKVQVPLSTITRLLRSGYNGTTRKAPQLGRPTTILYEVERAVAEQVRHRTIYNICDTIASAVQYYIYNAHCLSGNLSETIFMCCNTAKLTPTHVQAVCWAKRGFTLETSFIVQLANKVLKKLCPRAQPIRQTSKWLKSFIRRHKDLVSSRIVEKRSARRIMSATPETIAKYYILLQQLFAEHSVGRQTRNSMSGENSPVSSCL